MRIGIVGASSLLGKELAEELGNSSLATAEVVLLDSEEASGRITSVGDEAAFIQKIEPTSFHPLHYVFFAGEPADTKKHWLAARKAGAVVIDLSNALRAEPGVTVRSSWLSTALPDLATTAVIPAHAVSVMLGLVASRCSRFGLTEIAATVLLPASEHGQAAMDELHQQTVSLLSFQPLPKVEFDAQVAFNLLPALGPAARVKLEKLEEQIYRDYTSVGILPKLTMQLIQAPVFHGYGISLLLNSARGMTSEEIEGAIAGEHIEVVSEDVEAPSNLSAAGHGSVLARVSRGEGTRMWIWMAADNLKLAALNAIACAVELQQLKPQGKIQ